jgi:hypothetical protein
MSGMRLAFSLAWKVVVLVEVFGLSTGVGYALNSAFISQDVAAVLAWTLAFTVVVAAIEYGVFQTIERRVTRWKKEHDPASRRRPGEAGQRARAIHRRGPAAAGHGVPAATAVRLVDGGRQYRRRRERGTRAPIRWRCRAGSGSVWRWRGRLPSSPTRYCSTSRSARSTN